MKFHADVPSTVTEPLNNNFVDRYRLCVTFSVHVPLLTPGNSLSVAFRAVYLSVLMEGGESDRRELKARRTNGLTYLLTAFCFVHHFLLLHSYDAQTLHKMERVIIIVVIIVIIVVVVVVITE